MVDPIDGTSNFVAGLPLFGVMAAAVMAGEVVAGAIHDPIGDDTAVALRGQGAWTWSPDGASTPKHVSEASPPERMTGAISWRYMPDPLRGKVVRNMVRLGGVSCVIWFVWAAYPTIVALRMSTGCWRPGIATTWCSTS